MATELSMPALAGDMADGTLSAWKKKEGDPVKAGEIVAEIETDKAVFEIEAPRDGILGRILVADGTSGVKVNATLGWIVDPGEAVPGDPAATEASTSTAATATAQASTSADRRAASAVAGDGQRRFASPIARRLADGYALDLAAIEGTGPHGRIVKVDIERARTAAQTAKPVHADAAAAAYEAIPHSSMRRTIAARLQSAKQTIPHFYLTIDCEVGPLLALRDEIRSAVQGTRVSLNDFIVKAVALALREVPGCNASWTDDAIVRHFPIDVAVAVATPGGLVTPIVRDADHRSIGQIAGELDDLVHRARAGRLTPDEYQGGGFTVSNLGMYGIREFSAIINPPQSCILAVGAAEARPVVREGTLAVATMMTCSLSCDHRVVDGALGAQFLAEFRRRIERPIGLML